MRFQRKNEDDDSDGNEVLDDWLWRGANWAWET